jgi:hypothetical protein
MKSRFVVSAFAVMVAVSALTVAHTASAPPAHAEQAPAADDTPVAATSSHCKTNDLADQTDTARNDPEWTPVLGDPNQPLNPDIATILQGTVATPEQNGQQADDPDTQAASEVSEEELPWNHYTHDKTENVLPDPGYQHLLSSWKLPDGSTASHTHVEVEDESASLMGDNRTWGAQPEFVWPSVRDRVWMSGRWVFDCGHPGSAPTVVYDANNDGRYTPDDTPADFVVAGSEPSNGIELVPEPKLKFVDNGDNVWFPGETLIFDTNDDGVYDAGDGVAQGITPPVGTPLHTDPLLKRTDVSYDVSDPAYAQFSTEIHPPRGFVTFRDHPGAGVAGDSWLPITGTHTNVPVTEADMFFSGNGGGANDRCSLIDRHIKAVRGVLTDGLLGIDDCAHTGPVIPINDRNYVFDVYPPGTNYDTSGHDPSTAWPVTPPTSDASLQWRWIDHGDQIPDHACGLDKSVCVNMDTTQIKVCPIGASTPPPTDALDNSGQMESSCPPAPVFPERATRLRVILPFNGTSLDTVLARSLLLGWDDVPATPATSVRTFKITLHQLDVVHNGESFLHSGDWRVFVDVGGQWRYMSNQYDQVNGSNACSGTSLDQVNGAGGNGDGDCFQFDDTPWYVSVQNGTPIHVAVGGFESDSVDSDYCPQSDTGNYWGCDPSPGSAIDLAASNDDRIGTYEFDLCGPNHDAVEDGYPQQPCSDYSAPAAATTERLPDGEQYKTTFTVQEVGTDSPPVARPLGIGAPEYTDAGGTTFVTSATPLDLSSKATESVGFQYRYYRDGTPVPDFGPWADGFDTYWTNTDEVAGPRIVPIYIGGFDGADGPYTVEFSATHDGITEPRHTANVTLDNTPPTITINQPKPITYTHSQMFNLDYLVDDGAGSGVESVTPTMDGLTTIGGHGLQSGQAINLLTDLTLGTHTFTVNAADNVGNANSQTVTFTIIVTAQSIIDDVTQFFASGAISTQLEATALVSKLQSAKKARAAGNCANAATIYQSFISLVQAQIGKKITPAAGAVLIADANYLITHCP